MHWPPVFDSSAGSEIIQQCKIIHGTHTHTHIPSHAHTNKYIHTLTHTHMHSLTAHIHTQTHTHTHTFKHTPSCTVPERYLGLEGVSVGGVGQGQQEAPVWVKKGVLDPITPWGTVCH